VLESEKKTNGKDLARAAKTLFSLGAPDCPVVHRTVFGAPGWRWSTGRSRELDGGVWLKITRLSGEPTVGRANGRPRNPRVTRGRANGLMGAPDSVRCVNDSKSSTVCCTRIGKKYAPDCPVHQSTEGKICLPGLLSTAPSCLEAIKGTPRQMKEYTKHSLIIS
jgi:hypothetical protein